VNDMPVLPACSAPGRRRRASAALHAAEETSRCRTFVIFFHLLSPRSVTIHRGP